MIKLNARPGLPSILALFRNEFNEYRPTDVRLYLSFVIEMTLKLHFSRENVKILS